MREMLLMQYYVGDLVKMKKKHPCGSDDWEVLRTGMDFRIKCCKCARQVWLPRTDFEKAVKKLVKRSPDAPPEN